MSTVRDPVFGCLIATGRKDRDGYAFCGRTRAHIAAWVRTRGPVPDGLELDHLCRVRACCAVHHLEPVTRSEQEKRKFLHYRLRRTHCPAGHALVGSNRILTSFGGIVCRSCNNAAATSKEAGEQ